MGGAVRVAEELAASLSTEVRTGVVVRSIRHDSDGVQVESRDGQVVTGSHAVVTLPPTLAGRIDYSPVMPGWRDQLTQRLPAGSVIKVHVVYSEPFWRDDGLTGQVASEEGPVKITFDNSPPSGTPGIIVGFLEGDDGRRWARRTEAERRDVVVACMERYFGPRAAIRWSTSNATGWPRSSAVVATAPTSPPGCGPASARRSPRPSVASTGQERSVPRCGTGTWKGRCARASVSRAT